MADRYWVGGTGSWDATTTTNWSATSGGSGGASAPTSADNVIFNSASNATGYTVTVGTNAVCNDLNVTGPASGNVTFSLPASARLDPYGSMTLPATGLVWTGVAGALVTFRATTTGKTITTNGVTLTLTAVAFNGVGGGWTLGSAFTVTGGAFTVINGTFDSGSFNITGTSFNSNFAGTRAINLGSSTVTLNSNLNFAQTTGFTFNAGTSQITCSNANTTFTGGAQTFYNVSFTAVNAGTTTISDANTFNNLTQTSRSVTGTRVVSLGANQTISGILTLGAANTSIRRIQVQSSVVGTQRTITVDGSLAALADCDFRDIATAGSVGTWTGTRLGNGLGNSGITFDASKDVYWNLAAGGSWSATGWALSSGGAVDTNNFPLAQDRVIIENTGLNTSATITIDVSWWIGELDLSTRSNAMTLANISLIPRIHKNVTLSSAVTMTGTGAWQFVGQGTTQILDTNTTTFVPPIAIESATGTLQLAEDTTCSATFTLTSGTLDLSNGNRVLTCSTFVFVGALTRAILFGSGNINVTATTGVVLNCNNGSGFSYTGTPAFNLTGGGAGTRTITLVQSGFTEANSVNVYITSGSGNIATSGTGLYVRTLDFTGFSGTFSRTTGSTHFGNLIFGSGMTVTASGSFIAFSATSGIQQVATNGVVLDNPITQNGVGGAVQLQDNLTIGTTRTYTLANGSLDVNGKILTAGIFTSSGVSTRTLNLGANGRLVVNGGNCSVSTTGLTFSGTGTISMDFATAKIFSGGGGVYPYTLNQGGAGALTITGANTFANITNTVQPATVTFPASTITSVYNFGLLGTAGNLITINSSIAGTQATINNISGGPIVTDYLSIQDSNATPATTMYAGRNSTNVSNNIGWVFATLFAVLVEESSTITDAENAQLAFALSTEESLTLTDEQSVQMDWSVSTTEFYGSTDSVPVTVIFVPSISEAITLIDELIQRGWIKINDNQNPNWGAISNNQTPVWGDINDDQTPGWADIDNYQG